MQSGVARRSEGVWQGEGPRRAREIPSHRGRKICLTTDASALVTDAVVEMGNPADATFAVKMIERQKELFGKAPKEVSFDGGFASRSKPRSFSPSSHSSPAVSSSSPQAPEA